MPKRRTPAAVAVLVLAAFLASCQTKDDTDVTPVVIPA